MKKTFWISLVCGVAVVAVVGCGSTESAEDTVASEAAGSATTLSLTDTSEADLGPYDGLWEGTTTEGTDISFAVEDGAVTTWSFKIDTTLEDGEDGFPFTGKTMLIPIEEQRAEWSMGGKTLVWVFSSETEASGSYSYEHPTHGLLTSEWTATKK